MINVNVRITGEGVGVQSFVDYIRTLPFATVEEQATPKKMTFEEACVKYNCMSVDEFTDKVNASIKEYFHPSCAQ